MDCQARARCAHAGKRCRISVKWATACWSDSTAPRRWWAAMTGRPWSLWARTSNLRTSRIWSTRTSLRISASQIEKQVRWEQRGVYATARPWTLAAVICCAASEASGRRRWCLRRTAYAVSTGVVSSSAKSAWFEKSLVSVTDELKFKVVKLLC